MKRPTDAGVWCSPALEKLVPLIPPVFGVGGIATSAEDVKVGAGLEGDDGLQRHRPPARVDDDEDKAIFGQGRLARR